MTFTVAAACVVMAAGCGDDDGAAATDAAESDYCDEAREWATPILRRSDAYWEEWVAFQEAAVDTAPEEIKGESETFTPILEKYNFVSGPASEQLNN